MVLVSSEAGEKPIAEQHREHRASLFDQARRDPRVKAALAAFPGSEIVNVEQPGQAGAGDDFGSADLPATDDD